MQRLTTDDNVFDRFGKPSIFASGCLLGTGIGIAVGVFVVSPHVSSFQPVEIPFRLPWRAMQDAHISVFGAKPRYSLRLIQAIGILLPLFTGLLRFTTDDESAVSESVNDYLLLGVLGLVLGGVFAAVGGIATDTAVILKLSLIVVVFTFTLIGLAAMVMLREMTPSTEGLAESPDSVDNSDTEVETSEPEDGESDASDGSEPTDDSGRTESETTERDANPSDTDSDEHEQQL